jgi:hypothetical protein
MSLLHDSRSPRCCRSVHSGWPDLLWLRRCIKLVVRQSARSFHNQAHSAGHVGSVSALRVWPQTFMRSSHGPKVAFPFDRHFSPVDTSHVLGTMHLYKYCPRVRFPPIVGKCVFLSLGYWLLRSHKYFILDKQTSDVRGQSALFSTSNGQVHGSWEHDHIDQVNIWQVCSSTNVLHITSCGNNITITALVPYTMYR